MVRREIDEEELESMEATPASARSNRLPEPGRTLRLLARRADVHVDFHADLHFDDLRSFPSHSALPSI
jgi:hypothetical protein